MRDCYMPRAGLGARKELWITENGYATNRGHTEARQAAELEDTIGSSGDTPARSA